LTVETGVKEDSKSTNEKGPSLVGSLGNGHVVLVQEIFVWLFYSSRPSTKYFSSLYIISIPLTHRPASWAGSRAGSPVSGDSALKVPHYTEDFSFILIALFSNKPHRVPSRNSNRRPTVWVPERGIQQAGSLAIELRHNPGFFTE
jgi:hypothetical protein